MAFGRVIAIVVLLVKLSVGQYLPNWSSLDTRPLPQWYDQAKFGIFIHWGVYSVPSTQSEWFWYYWKTDALPYVVDFMTANYPPNFTYPDFAPQFHTEYFDPDQWADVFQASGARYVVLTSKHEEGYTMWPSSYSWNWNSQDVGPSKDLVGLLANSIRNRTDLHFGLYYALEEWYHPLYVRDKAGGFVNRTYPQYKTIPELHEIVNTYKPEVIWSDGDYYATSDYWGSTEFLAWLYNESPVRETVVVNDRWGQDADCAHGDFYACYYNYNPRYLQPHKWERHMPIDKLSYGYRRAAVLGDFETIESILFALVTSVSCGGNLLLNVGPTADGRLIPIFEERLRQTGQWLSINGEGIYDSQPWTFQNDTVTPNVWYTINESSGVVYAFFFAWPRNYSLTLGAPTATGQTTVTLLGSTASPLPWQPTGSQGMEINLPYLIPAQLQWAWTLALHVVL